MTLSTSSGIIFTGFPIFLLPLGWSLGSPLVWPTSGSARARKGPKAQGIDRKTLSLPPEYNHSRDGGVSAHLHSSSSYVSLVPVCSDRIDWRSVSYRSVSPLPSYFESSHHSWRSSSAPRKSSSKATGPPSPLSPTFFPVVFFPVLYISVKLIMRVCTVRPDEMDFVTNVPAEFNVMTCIPVFFLLSLGLGLTHAHIDTMIHRARTGWRYFGYGWYVSVFESPFVRAHVRCLDVMAPSRT